MVPLIATHADEFTKEMPTDLQIDKWRTNNTKLHNFWMLGIMNKES